MKFLLSPLALIYWVIIAVRNKCFDYRILPSVKYDFPVIVVGNLRVGGTGKTPMVNYLVKALHTNNKVAVLSRGYGRKTQGFLLANEDSTAEQIGDEPLLIQRTFPSVTLAVDEKRAHGIEQLRRNEESRPEVVLLDDAMQHRSVEPGMLIMLTAYNKLFVDDCMLPGGRLREPKSSAERAHAVVVTKCPISLSIEERKVIESKVRAYTESAVFFAFELYSSIRSLESESSVIPLNDLKDYSVVLFSGLADPSNLEKWAKENTQTAEHIAFNDHHWFSENDLERIKSVFEKLNAEKRLILTTEKDAIRITKLLQNKKFADLPIYAIRHEMSFFEEDQVPFEKKINDFIGSHSTNE